jgi:hypothetical protein
MLRKEVSVAPANMANKTKRVAKPQINFFPIVIDFTLQVPHTDLRIDTGCSAGTGVLKQANSAVPLCGASIGKDNAEYQGFAEILDPW